MQLANRQFAIGNLSKYKLCDIEKTEYKSDILQDIQIPYQANIEKVNAVKIGSKYYDIVGIDDATYYGRSTVLRIRYNPISTLLSAGQTVKGWWDRTPIKAGELQTIQAVNSTYIEREKSNLYKLPDGYYWIQISARYDTENVTSGNLTIYGTIIFYDELMSTFEATRTIKTASNKILMGYYDIVNDITEITGIDGASIIDISVSPRCPYQFNFTGDTKFDIFDIKKSVGFVEPLTTKVADKHIYKLSGSMALPYGWSDITTVEINERKAMNGKITLYDELGNPIYQIPNSYLDYNSTTKSYTLRYKSKCIPDITSLNTVVTFMSNDASSDREYRVIIPGGHFPWFGSSWGDYQSRTLSLDRENLARAVSNVDKQRDIDMFNSVGNSMLTLGLAGATNPMGAIAGVAQMGIGLATSEMQNNLAKENLYAEQHAKENLIKNSPSQNYQTGYGLDYLCRINNWGGACIKIEMPRGIVEDEVNPQTDDFMNYIAYRGYPCGKYAGFQLPASGYIKGNIYNDFSNKGNSVETDMLRREIANGFRFVVIT